MNKEQIKHLADVIKEIATAQFIFAGGRNLYLYSKSNEIDMVVLGLSGLLYVIAHVMIHLILSGLED